MPRDAAGRRYSIEQAAQSIRQVGWRSELLGPWLAPLALAALWWRRESRWTWVWAGFVAFFFACWWLLTHRIDRFWLPVLPVLALLAGAGAVWTREAAWRYLLIGAMIVGAIAGVLCLSAPPAGFPIYPSYLTALEHLRRGDSIDEAIPPRVSAAHRYMNQHASDGEAVLLVGDAQAFDLEPPTFYSTCFDDCLFETLLAGRDREQRIAALRERNIRYVYVS